MGHKEPNLDREDTETKDDFIHFRVDRELMEALDSFAAKQEKKSGKKFSRAKAVRVLLASGLLEENASAVYLALLNDVRRATNNALKTAGRELIDRLPALVKSELG